jgi:carbamoyl-phosphate synthase large subunit
VRPSFVLGGRAMEICYDEQQLTRYMTEAVDASPDHPVLIDKFLEDAIEVDVDAISDGDVALVGGVMEHIEEAGVHSGDSACALPPYSLPQEVIEEIRQATYALAKELKVCGLMNVQYAVKKVESGERRAESALSDSQIFGQRPQSSAYVVYVLEVNPRASRTSPFVSKATGLSLARMAAKCMVGVTLAEQGITEEVWPAHTSVKESVFPFARFAGVDIILGPEMRSTGEVMGIDDTFEAAFAKSQIAAGIAIPSSGKVFISMARRHKHSIVGPAQRLVKLGFRLLSTSGTAAVLREAGLEVEVVRKIQEGRPDLRDYMANGDVQLIFNTPSGKGARTDEGQIRAAAVTYGVPCVTTLPGCVAMVRALEHRAADSSPRVQALQEWGERRVESRGSRVES